MLREQIGGEVTSFNLIWKSEWEIVRERVLVGELGNSWESCAIEGLRDLVCLRQNMWPIRIIAVLHFKLFNYYNVTADIFDPALTL